ncbi:MAG TPA: aminotransferase class V-fold PLP-dependent enzyme [Cyclobacteriaceae bacterium]|nr:aminotransferase class V-fold PLP-dependent enzyme [Cyclobacteriaceae bacterium]
MTSRRKFIKSGLSGLTAMPLLSEGFPNKNSPLPDFRTATNDDELFAMVRKQLLVPENRIYLNTGSLGPSPVQVIDSMLTYTRQLEMNPVGENWGPLGNQMELVRKKVADFIHADVEEVILTRNTTEGLNLIAQSFDLKKDDEILTTTLEHGGGEVGLEFLVKTKGAVLKKMELPMLAKSVEEIVKAIEKNISPKTKVLMLSHVNTVTGMLMPFEEISKITKPKGISLIADGAQAPGLTKVDVKALGIDAYSASGHKWLMGPKETGFLYLSKSFQEKVKPVFTSSGFATYTASSGTRNVATIIGLGVALDWHTSIGLDKIEQRCLEMRAYCLGELKKLNGLKVISPEAKELSTGIVSFSLDTAKNTNVFNKLKEQEIIVKLLTQYNAIRISCHMFVSKQDIDKFIKALRVLV